MDHSKQYVSQALQILLSGSLSVPPPTSCCLPMAHTSSLAQRLPLGNYGCLKVYVSYPEEPSVTEMNADSRLDKLDGAVHAPKSPEG